MRTLLRLTPLLLTAALFGCGPDKGEFAPPCPRPSLVRGLEDLTRFRTGGTDLTDMVVQGRMVAINGSCNFVERKSLSVEVTVTATAEFLRGPAMQGRTATIPVFIAVTEGNTVLDKQVIDFPVEFPSNIDRAGMVSQPIRVVLPTTREKSPAAFGIVAGFQLSADELATNKHRAAGR